MNDYYEHTLDPAGVRPEWLADDDGIKWFSADTEFWFGPILACKLFWDGPSEKTAIRIPTDHWAVPFLKRGEVPRKDAQLTLPEGVTPELDARAWALVAQLAAQNAFQGRFTDEARAILAERGANIAAARPDPQPDPIDELVSLLAPVLTHSQGMAASEREGRFRTAMKAIAREQSQ